MYRFLFIILALLLIAGCGGGEDKTAAKETADNSDTTTSLIRPGEEKHLANIRQLSFGGENAEAYFSADGQKLIFQSKRDSFECDQIYTMNIDGSDVQLVSTGKGRTTCSFLSPDGSEFIYASTHLNDPNCPPPPDMSHGYVWGLFPGYDVFRVNFESGEMVNLTADNPDYDAECAYSPDGKKIVFTSVRDGDIDLYTMNTDGTELKRITSEFGYDGGPFFGPDSKWICYRADHPKEEQAVADFKALLERNQIRPGNLELFVIKADGSERHQVTNLGGANFCPYFHPDGKRLIFASNHHSGDRNFDLFLVNIDGTGLERITFDEDFEGFPMFSADGKKLVFASNRNQGQPGETNIFIADWID